MLNNENNSYIDLFPAKWIWFPSERTLSNTFVLFRRKINLKNLPCKASGWITAESRYKLTVNGQRVQWGPGPSDPRWPDVDPFDITDFLKVGENTIGVEVLYYGFGDGTWVMGKPGLILKLDIELGNGETNRFVSDGQWDTCLDRAHKPGQFKRWYLRSLQEEFDARIHPWGWDTNGFEIDRKWMKAMVIDCPSDKPVLCSNYYDYLNDSNCENIDDLFLRKRQIPLLKETKIPVKSLAEQGIVKWDRQPDDWFEFRTPNSLRIFEKNISSVCEDNSWELLSLENLDDGRFLTFEFEEQMVGWPYFTIIAPEGTIVELICHEAHDSHKTLWLDTQRFAWSRFICKEGKNEFICYDFESLKWLQLHIHNCTSSVQISEVGVLRRLPSWYSNNYVHCSESSLNRLFSACINTIFNNAQDTLVDGMSRERQQYSGDLGHELHAIRYAFGDTTLPARFLRTYSEGLALEGYFIDCWPAYDRMVRIPQREIGLTKWGPILDHSIQFVFDCWFHYMETGKLEDIIEPYPRLIRFAQYLENMICKDGLLPVEEIGVPIVWLDHEAYSKQKHKQCAFNLYASAMYKYALAPIARLFNDMALAEHYMSLSESILNATIEHFWSNKMKMFVCNLPWLNEEKNIKLCDRSLATAIIFDQCPKGEIYASVKALAECPIEMGLSYPANAGWRYHALAQYGRIEVILSEFRNHWAKMKSVINNNTMQEFWKVGADTVDQWSHASVAPLYILLMDIIGIKPVLPGFKKIYVCPQLGDLGDVAVKIYTPVGIISFIAKKMQDYYDVSLVLPRECDAELLLPSEEVIDSKMSHDYKRNFKKHKLISGEENRLILYT